MKQIEFSIPDGFHPPEGTMEGDTFESMSTLRLKPKGRLCLVAIGETKLPGYDNGETSTYDSGSKEVVRRYHKAMGE